MNSTLTRIVDVCRIANRLIYQRHLLWYWLVNNRLNHRQHTKFFHLLLFKVKKFSFLFDLFQLLFN